MIIYKFLDDKKFYTCYVTYEQYKNFKELPIVKECKIVKRNQQNIDDYNTEMEKALNMAIKNDTTHIRKMSNIV